MKNTHVCDWCWCSRLRHLVPSACFLGCFSGGFFSLAPVLFGTSLWNVTLYGFLARLLWAPSSSFSCFTSYHRQCVCVWGAVHTCKLCVAGSCDTWFSTGEAPVGGRPAGVRSTGVLLPSALPWMASPAGLCRHLSDFSSAGTSLPGPAPNRWVWLWAPSPGSSDLLPSLTAPQPFHRLCHHLTELHVLSFNAWSESRVAGQTLTDTAPHITSG